MSTLTRNGLTRVRGRLAALRTARDLIGPDYMTPEALKDLDDLSVQVVSVMVPCIHCRNPGFAYNIPIDSDLVPDTGICTTCDTTPQPCRHCGRTAEQDGN